MPTIATGSYEQGSTAYGLWSAAAAVLAASVSGVASCSTPDEGVADGMPAAISKAMRSTVRIESWAYVSSGGFWGSGAASTAPVPTKVSSGSGVVYDAEERLILTNAHVLDSPPGLGGVATRVKVVFSGGQVREGRVVAVDRDCDIGLLRIEEPRWRLGSDSERVELVEAHLGESTAMTVGTRRLAWPPRTSQPSIVGLGSLARSCKPRPSPSHFPTPVSAPPAQGRALPWHGASAWPFLGRRWAGRSAPRWAQLRARRSSLTRWRLASADRPRSSTRNWSALPPLSCRETAGAL